MEFWPARATKLDKAVHRGSECRGAKRNTLILLVFCFLLNVFCVPKCFAWWSVTGDVDRISTHDAVGKRALLLVGPKLSSQFLTDKVEMIMQNTYYKTNDEAAHADDGERNGGPIQTWFDNFLYEYNQGPTHWDEAAKWLGYCVHLIEDMNVPAHALNIPHAMGSFDNLPNVTGDAFEFSAQRYPLITFRNVISEGDNSPLPINPATYYYNEARQKTKKNIENFGLTNYWKAGITGIDEDYKGDGPRGRYGGILGVDVFPISSLDDNEKYFLELQLNQSVEYVGMFLIGVDRVLAAQATDDFYEENDVLSSATKVTVPFNDATMKCNDEDWFKVWVQKEEKVTITINFLNANGDLDVYLYDSSGYALESSRSVNNTESISFGPVSTDNFYYINVHGYNGARNSYAMSVKTYTTTRPDLRAKQDNSQSTVVTEGDDFWMSWYIYNSGLSVAGASHASLYLSTNGNFSTYGDYKIGDISVSPLEPLTGQWVTWTFKMPNLSSGQYPVWGKVIVDSWDEVYEGIESLGPFVRYGSHDFTAYEVRSLTGLSIIGSNNVDESSSAAYSAVASWSDGTTSKISPIWGESSLNATISSGGVLTTTAVTGDKVATITASYNYGNDTKTATQLVTIVDVTATLTDISIFGPNSVFEGRSAQYIAIANWNNGTSSVISPTWSESSSYTSINSQGLLTVSSIPSDQTNVVAASYTFNGVTKTSTRNVNLVNSDSVPDSFTFSPQTNIALNTVTTSNSITITGINSSAPISITGGSYSINGGAYTTTAGTVDNGNKVMVRLTSSSSYSTTTSATLTIGGVSGIFSVMTKASPFDTTPSQFAFTAQISLAPGTVATSNGIWVSGINAAAPISIAGGTYSINGGAYTSMAGTVNNGNTVTVRLTSSPNYSTMTSATLTIGGVSGTFSVTTQAAPIDTVPDPFIFTMQTNSNPSTVVTSNAITISGINVSAPISVIGGTYATNGGAYTSAAGTVNNGDTVRVQLTSSAGYSATASATLTIGGMQSTFSVTTQSSPSALLTLTMTFAGTGRGSVSGDISCISGEVCSAKEFVRDTNITLLATPDAMSTFQGWSGSCTNSTKECSVRMDTTKSVTVAFAAAPKVMVGSKEFSSLQAAYDDVGTRDNATIQLLQGKLIGDYVANGELDVIVKGGYNSDYATSSTKTIIHGNIAIRAGSIRFQRVVIGSPYILGDLNSDGTVDMLDYGILHDNYGQTQCGNIADINGDCVVNEMDYDILHSNYGKSN